MDSQKEQIHTWTLDKIIPFILVAMFILGMILLLIFIFQFAEDQTTIKKLCSDDGGELISGKNEGCLIGNEIHTIVKTKSGFRILK